MFTTRRLVLLAALAAALLSAPAAQANVHHPVTGPYVGELGVFDERVTFDYYHGHITNFAVHHHLWGGNIAVHDFAFSGRTETANSIEGRWTDSRNVSGRYHRVINSRRVGGHFTAHAL